MTKISLSAVCLVLVSQLAFSPGDGYCQSTHIRHVTPELLETVAPEIDRFPGEAGKRSLDSSATFSVRDIRFQDHFAEIQFDLVCRAPKYTIWISRSGLAAVSRVGHADAFVNAFCGSGNEQSRTDAIIETVVNAFGPIPDVDADGRVDLAFLDIRDDFTETGQYVAGFFDPINLADATNSNRRDLVFLDLEPTLVRGETLVLSDAASTFAHELQHLIHAGYEVGSRELTFVNEGMSELAEVLTGHPGRNPGWYFRDSARPLFSWNRDDPLPDYSRAAQWTHYVYERLGIETIRAIVASPLVGLEGVDQAVRSVTGIGFSEIFADWGIELLSGRGVVAAEALHMVSELVAGPLPVAGVVEVPPLAHAIFQVEYPSGAELIVDDPFLAQSNLLVASAASTMAGSISSLHVQRANGTVWLDANRDTPYVRVLLTNPDLAGSSSSTYNYLVRGGVSHQKIEIGYDDGVADRFSGEARYLTLGHGQSIATRFRSVDVAVPITAKVKVLFESELTGSGPKAALPRRLRLQVYSDSLGSPGRAIGDPVVHTVTRPLGSISWETVPLFAETIDEQPATRQFFLTLSAADSTNALSVALDRDDKGHQDRATFIGNGPLRWVSLTESHALIERDEFHAMMRAIVLAAPERTGLPQLEMDVIDSGDSIFVSVGGAFDMERLRMNVTCLVTPGRVVPVQAPIVLDKSRLLFPLSARIPGDYLINAVAVDVSGREVARGSLAMSLLSEPRIRTTIYPLPSSGETFAKIQVESHAQVSMTLFDLLGRRIAIVTSRRFPPGQHTVALPTTGYAAGSYFLRIEATDESGRIVTTNKTLMIID